MGETYDSAADTLEHIQHVRDGIGEAIRELAYRAKIHDWTKLGPNEKPTFDRVTPLLRGLTYGSPEYKASLESMGPALQHHYASHRHHPEHFGEAGMRGMNLVDALEMVIDWHASVKRHADGDLHRSIEINQARFGYDDMLKAMMHNTAHWLLSLGAEPKMQNIYERAREHCTQDGFENAPFASVGGPEKRHDMQAPAWVKAEDRAAYLAGYRDMAREAYGEDWMTCSFSWRPAMTIGGDE